MYMKITTLENDLYLYQIPAENEQRLGINLYVVCDGSDALLIDAGYRRQLTPVLADLGAKGIRAAAVLPSHYHPDHVDGIALLGRPAVYGNAFAAKTARDFFSGDALDAVCPTEIIDERSTLHFGRFTITFEHAPGHSDCSILIHINDAYLHVGDLYLRTDDGRPVLPYVKWPGVLDHIESLKRILRYKHKRILLSHGLCPVCQGRFETGVADRLAYLEALRDSNNTVSVDQATKGCAVPFTFRHWRDFVD